MPKLPKGKSQMNVYINKKVLKVFKKIVKEKHEGMTGLSLEVETAMQNWIRLHTHEHTLQSLDKLNPSPPIYQRWQKVRTRLEREYGGNLPQQISRFELEKSIMNEIGFDKRTIKKYLRSFEKMGIIKIVSASIIEIS